MQNHFNISLEDAKAQLNVEHDEDDSIITTYISAAVEAVLADVNLGGVLGRKRQFSMSSKAVKMGYPTTSESVKVEERLCDGKSCEWFVMDDDTWSLEAIDDLTQTLTITDEAYKDVASAMRVSYIITLEDPPAAFTQAALMLLANFYDNRSAVVVGQGVTSSALPKGVEALLAPHRSVFVV